MHNKCKTKAMAGDNVGFNISNVTYKDFKRG